MRENKTVKTKKELLYEQDEITSFRCVFTVPPEITPSPVPGKDKVNDQGEENTHVKTQHESGDTPEQKEDESKENAEEESDTKVEDNSESKSKDKSTKEEEDKPEEKKKDKAVKKNHH